MVKLCVREAVKLVVLVASTAVFTTAARAADWDWSVAPYLWGAGLDLDLTRNADPVLAADISFSDLLDKTELAAMVHVEAQRGRIGFFVDALYLSVSDTTVRSANPPLPGGTTVDSDVDTGLYEVGGFYRVLPGDRQLLDILGGARWADFEQTHDIALPSPSTLVTTATSSHTYFDGFVGARYGHDFAERWDFVLRGDVGGGGTERAWNAVGTVGVRFGDTDKYTLRAGYRHLELEIEDRGSNGGEITTDVTFSGPIVGFVFAF